MGTVGDIVDQIQDGLHGVRHYVPVGVPLLGVGNVAPEGIDLTNANYITAEDHERLKASHIRKGDLLVTITGRLGTAALYQSEQPANLSAHVALCRMRAGHEPLFLKYFLASRFGEASLTKAQIGSTHPHINVRRLKELPLPIPPQNVQKHLVNEMEMARNSRRIKLQQANELIDTLDEWLYKKIGVSSDNSIRHKVFAVRYSQLHGALNPERYASVQIKKHIGGITVGQICAVLNEKISPAKVAPTQPWDRIRIDDLPSYPLQIDTIQTEIGQDIDGSFFDVKGNDILIARLGPTIQNAKFVLCPPLKRRTVASAEFLVLRCNESWNPEVVLWILRTRLFRDIMYSLCRGGTPSRYRLNAEDLAQMPFPAVSTKLQISITNEVRHRREEARRLRAEAEAEWAAAKERFEEQLLGGSENEAVAIMADKWQNKDKEASHDKGRNKKGSAKAGRVAKKPQGYKGTEEGISEEDSGLGGKVHGIREGAGEYDPAEGTPRNGEDSTRPIASTRYFETAQGTKTYCEVAEIIAVSVTKTIEGVVEQTPEDIHITSEWICKLHHDVASALFPDWAGHFRAVNVKVGTHTPPPFYEVPVHMRLYCKDLAVRLASNFRENDILKFAETLAFADWRFQWIHPFKDFNGRVGRIILTALLYMLKLPPAETASPETKEREKYLEALRVADGGDFSSLTEIWVERLLKALDEK